MKTVQVKINENTVANQEVVFKNDVVTVEENDGKILVGSGRASYVEKGKEKGKGKGKEKAQDK